MNLLEKLLTIQSSIDVFVKNMQIGEGKSSYTAVSSDQVLEIVRPLMNEHKLLLEMNVDNANVTVGSTGSGTTRYFTEIHMTMTWIDTETGESRPVKWYAQGVDLAGEKGVGKAYTYSEKYFMMKYFHVPTPKDDPDGDSTTKKGEKRIANTQAAKEIEEMQRLSIQQMLNEMYGVTETEKHKEILLFLTKSKDGNYAGIDIIGKLKSTQVTICYARLKDQYKKRLDKNFVFNPTKTESELPIEKKENSLL